MNKSTVVAVAILTALSLTGCTIQDIKRNWNETFGDNPEGKEKIPPPPPPPPAKGAPPKVVPEVRLEPKPEAKPAPKPAPQRRTECDWEAVMSEWCGNLLERTEDLQKRGVVLRMPSHEHAFFFKKSINLRLAEILRAIKVNDKSILPEDLEGFAQELRVNGFPVPSSEGRSARAALIEFFEKHRFREVACTPEHMKKYGMSFNSKDRKRFGYYQRHCAQGEIILEMCVERVIVEVPPPSPAPKPEAKPAPKVSVTANACPDTERGFRVHVWRQEVQEVQQCLASSTTGFSSPDAFSRNRCIIGLVKGERSAGNGRPWHVNFPVKAFVETITPEGKVIERLREINLLNGYIEFKEPYAKLEGKHFRVVFEEGGPGEIHSPKKKDGTNLYEVRINPPEFERPICTYDISGIQKPKS